MAIYGYIRVSTTTQADNGESLEVQRRKIEARAQEQGWTLDRVFVERGVSGGKPLADRPQGKALLAVLARGDVLIASKLDRVFRSASDALTIMEGFKRQGVGLYLLDLGGEVTGNGIGAMVFTIMSAVAQFERERIAERIADMKADQKSRGRYLGGAVPFGYRKVVKSEGGKQIKQLEPVPKEQAAIKRMRRLHLEGKSLRVISQDMKKRGHDVSHEGVKRVLERKS